MSIRNPASFPHEVNVGWTRWSGENQSQKGVHGRKVFSVHFYHRACFRYGFLLIYNIDTMLDTMLDQRRRRLAGVLYMPYKCVVFVGWSLAANHIVYQCDTSTAI